MKKALLIFAVVLLCISCEEEEKKEKIEIESTYENVRVEIIK